jgi:hypothetical protein
LRRLILKRRSRMVELRPAHGRSCNKRSKIRMLTPTANRVERNTSGHVNRRIDRDMRDRVDLLSDRPGAAEARLNALDHEWDIERALEANAASLALAGVILAAAHDRRWLILPGLVAAFLLQHALQGWCPPLPLLRRAGFRTMREIDRERDLLSGQLARPKPRSSPGKRRGAQ